MTTSPEILLKVIVNESLATKAIQVYCSDVLRGSCWGFSPAHLRLSLQFYRCRGTCRQNYWGLLPSFLIPFIETKEAAVLSVL